MALKKKSPEIRIDSKFTGKITESMSNFVDGQNRWAEKYYEGKSSIKLLRAVKIRQKIAKFKKNLRSINFLKRKN